MNNNNSNEEIDNNSDGETYSSSDDDDIKIIHDGWNNKCSKCDKIEGSKDWLLCSGCGLWVHRRCVGVTKMEFIKERNKKWKSWFCSEECDFTDGVEIHF